jgi:hypothetical protein
MKALFFASSVMQNSDPMGPLTVLVLWGKSIHWGQSMEAILSFVTFGELPLMEKFK